MKSNNRKSAKSPKQPKPLKPIKNKYVLAFLENIYSLNNSKFFAGFVMLIMNIGSKYVSIELSDSQEKYLKYNLGRQLLIFAILWMGTRDIVIALVLTCIFILFADYLFNENSRYCLLPESYKELEKELDKNNDNKISHKEIQDAIKVLKRAHNKKKQYRNKSSPEDNYVNNGLLQENFI